MQRLWLGWLVLGLAACGDPSAPPEDPSAIDSRPQAGADAVPAASGVPDIERAADANAPGANPDITPDAAPGPAASDPAPPARVTVARSTMEEADKTLPRGLLPAGVTPLSYALELNVVPERERFSGHVDIAVELTAATDHIYMHGRSLAVTEAVAILTDGKSVPATYTQIHEDGIVRLEFARTIEAGRVLLEFDYTADFGRLLHSLYTVTTEGESYAFTQMQSVYAREAFPSFDEPAFKTPFELTLIVKQDHEAIANSPQISSQITDSGMKRVRFAPSPPMPSYLFAIAVGPFDVVKARAIPPNAVRKDPLPFRGFAVKGKGKELAYAMQETGKILNVLETYFDSRYPYSKLDIIAVPDFESGAMENIGAITFRERYLLINEDAPPQQKRWYAIIMAHELAHMWFGNLVTMPWWDDIWLNESFASWMAFKAVESYEPAHKSDITLLQQSHYAMREDSLTSARQIREPVEDNDDIVAAFDGITYSKGGAVLNMFEAFIGERNFREGVRAHIRRFASGSATVHDLIESLSSAAGQDLAPAANTFLFQNGVPLIDASLDCDNRSLELAQSRYLPIGSQGDSERLWQVPVCVKLGYGDEVSKQCVMLSEGRQSIPLEGPLENMCPDWVMPNADFAGYFHWLLPPSSFSALLGAGDRLNEKEWLSLADSARAGFDSGHLDVEAVWTVIEKLATSRYPSVARSMFPTIRYIEETLADDPKLRWTVRGRAASLYSELEAFRAFDAGFLKNLPDNETRIYYSDVASFMAETAYDQPTRSAALVKARAFLADEAGAGTVSRATLDTILTVGVQDGGQVFVDELYKRFVSSNDGWFRDTALSALARSRDPAFGEKLRQASLESGFRSNEIRRLFVSHMREDVNVTATWEWLKSNIDALVKVMPAQDVARLAVIGERLCDQEVVTELDDLMRSRLTLLPGGEHRIDIALERLKVCAESARVQRPQVRTFFSQGGQRR